MTRIWHWIRASHGLLFGWLGGLATAALIALVVGGWIVLRGAYNTSARSPHFPIVAWTVHKVMDNSVRRRADSSADALLDRADLMSGAHEYHEHCVGCHGGPGVARARWASAMLPTPPFLVDARIHWSRPELFYIIHDGVKMTAMPAWGEIEPRQKIADMAAFVHAMGEMTPAQFARFMAAAKQPRAGGEEHDSD